MAERDDQERDDMEEGTGARDEASEGAGSAEGSGIDRRKDLGTDLGKDLGASEDGERSASGEAKMAGPEKSGGSHPVSLKDRALFPVPTVSHFLSYSRTPRFLDARIQRALRANAPLESMLVHGPVGSGTTVLARAIAADYAPTRMVELDALDGIDPKILLRAIAAVRAKGVLLIRHVELLPPAVDTMLAHAIHGEWGKIKLVQPWDQGPLPSPSPLIRPGRYRLDRRPRFTLIGTSHVLGQVGYSLRMAFDHIVHLRDDPKALRQAVVRALRLRGIAVDIDAAERFERMLATVHDCAEPLVKCCLERAELERSYMGEEGVAPWTIDLPHAISIVEEDLPCRIGDESFASGLKRHLAGRKLENPGEDEIQSLAATLGWTPSSVRSAIECMVREASVPRIL